MAAGSLPADSPFAPETPTVTDHAATRWDERTSIDSVSPEAAWHDAVKLPPRALDNDEEKRIYEPQAVVLCRDGSAITTVMDAAGPDAEKWLQSMVYESVGPVWLDAPVEDRPEVDT